MSKQQSDLQKFQNFFGMDAHRANQETAEYRVQDLDNGLQSARLIIQKNQLNLVAETTGSMAQIRAFQVRIKEN